MVSLLRQGLLMALLACVIPVVLSQAETFNMDIRLGFFTDSNGVGLDPKEDPTDAQMFGLICASQVFLAKVLQNTTGDNTITMEMRDIAFVRDVPEPGGNDTEFHITFWGNFSTAPGGTQPSRAQIIEAFDINNPAFNATTYITDYASPSSPPDEPNNRYFFDVDSMAYNGSYGLPRAGTIDKAECEITEAPTYPPTNATDGPETDEGGDDDALVANVTDTDENVTDTSGNVTDDSAGGEDDGEDDGEGDDVVDDSQFGNGTFAPGAPTPAPGPDFANGTFSPDVYDNGTFAPGYPPDEGSVPTAAPGSDSRPPVSGDSQYRPEDYFNNGTYAPGVPTPAPGPDFANGTYAPGAPTPVPDDFEYFANGTYAPGVPTPAPGPDFANGTYAPGVPTPGPDGGGIGVDDGGDGSETPPPSDVASADNTNDMVYFTLQYRFKPGEGSEPTDDAMKSLICKTNLFFRDELRNETGDDSIQVEATNINWSYDEDNFEPLELTFTANVTTNGYQDTVPLDTVFKGMAVTTESILRYIEFYIWESEPTTYWTAVMASNFTNEANLPVPIGKLPTYQCPVTEAPSMSPTASPAPTATIAPSAIPTLSPAPTSSSAPSALPSISPAPTARPPTNNDRPTYGGVGTTPPIPSEPTISPMPTMSAAPTTGPSVSAAPTITPRPTVVGGGSGGGGGGVGVGGPAVRQPVTARFLVSNLEGITEPSEVNASGLSVSWPAFAEEVVNNVTSATRPSRSLRAGGRRLAVGYESGSASVDSIAQTDCPEGSHKDATCHDTTASYVLLLRGDEDPGKAEFDYGTGTTAAIDDGRYQRVLDREKPGTPLVIGTIPEPEGGGMPIWLLILIIVLCILCCLCMLLAIFCMMQKRGDEDKQLEPYDEEGFVYDFLIPPNEKPQTEVDDDATKAVDLDDGEGEDEEEFNDENEDEDKEEFHEDADKEEEVEVEAANLDNLEDIDGSEGELSEKGEDSFEEEDRAAVMPEEVEDESTPLVLMPEEQEALPISDDEEEPEADALEPKPDPDQEFGDHEDPPTGEEQWDDEVEPAPEPEAEPEPEEEPAAEEPEASEEDAEPELAEVASDGGDFEDAGEEQEGAGEEDEAAGSGGEEGWDEDQEGGEAAAAEEEGWDEDGSGGEKAAEEAEEWDEDNEGGGGEEAWEDEGAGEGAGDAGSDDGWDDEDAKA